MNLQEQALKTLSDIAQRIDEQIVDKWRYAQSLQEREQCATDLRALDELKTRIEADIADERRKRDK